MQKGFWEFAQGVEKTHRLKNKKIKKKTFAIREAGEGNQDTKEDSQDCRIKKRRRCFFCFLASVPG